MVTGIVTFFLKQNTSFFGRNDSPNRQLVITGVTPEEFEVIKARVATGQGEIVFPATHDHDGHNILVIDIASITYDGPK